MSDVIAVMNAGAIEQVLERGAEIYQRPANRFVADFIGESNLLSGAIEAIRKIEITFRTEKGLTVQAVSLAERRPSSSVFLVIRPSTYAWEAKPSGPRTHIPPRCEISITWAIW